MFVFRFESSITHVDDPLAPSHQLEDGTVVIGDNIMHSCYQIGRVCQAFRRAMVALNPEQNAWDKSEIPLLPKLFAVAGIANQSTQTDPMDPKLVKSTSEPTARPLPADGGSEPPATGVPDTGSTPSCSRVAVVVSANGAMGSDASGSMLSGESHSVVTCTARPYAIPIENPVATAGTSSFVTAMSERTAEALGKATCPSACQTASSSGTGVPDTSKVQLLSSQTLTSTPLADDSMTVPAALPSSKSADVSSSVVPADVAVDAMTPAPASSTVASLDHKPSPSPPQNPSLPTPTPPLVSESTAPSPTQPAPNGPLASMVPALHADSRQDSLSPMTSPAAPPGAESSTADEKATSSGEEPAR